MCNVLYCTVPYCTVLYCTVLYSTVLYSTVLYCTLLYCNELYYTVLYCTIIYCIVQYECITLYILQERVRGRMPGEPVKAYEEYKAMMNLHSIPWPQEATPGKDQDQGGWPCNPWKEGPDKVFYIVLYCTIIYYTVLYCTIIYCTVVYCTIMYYMYYTVHSPGAKKRQAARRATESL